MSVRLNIGLSRKLGLPNYGSVGASCAVEVELDLSALQNAETFQQRVEEAYSACRVAVKKELDQYQLVDIGITPPTENGLIAEPTNPIATAENEPVTQLATERQIEFAYQLARQIRALGGQRLKFLAERLYARPLEELTTQEASRMIDLLKQVRSGTRSIEDLLPSEAA